MKTLASAIAAVVDGDLNALSTVSAANDDDLLSAAAELPDLTISRPALIKVLKAWRSGLGSADDVQRWASFVRRGYIAGRFHSGVASIDIAYDANDEELIVEIIGRFDEIGDLIDGHIDDNEQEAMLKALET